MSNGFAQDIPHYGKSIIIRPEYIQITGSSEEAQILALFEEMTLAWEKEKDRARSMGVEEPSPWLVTPIKFIQSSLPWLTKKTIETSLKSLCRLEFLEQKDGSSEFKLKVENIIDALESQGKGN